MATDANLVLQALVTKTATFNGAGLDLLVGTPRRGLFAVVRYSAAANASGSNVVTFSIDESDDNSTFYQKTVDAFDAITLSTTAQAGEIFLPFETSHRYVRLTVTITGSGVSPPITYQAFIQLGRPS